MIAPFAGDCLIAAVAGADYALRRSPTSWPRRPRLSCKYFRTDVDAEVKSGKAVTIADQETEALIRQKIEATFPDHGSYGEEYGAVRTDAEFVWVLDPIDGTVVHHRKAMFGTLIGLLHRPRGGRRNRYARAP